MGRGIGRRIGLKVFMIFVTFIANILVLCMILSESKGQVEAKEEIVKEKEQPIDLEKFDVDDDGGFYVIEALLVPEEWKQ